MQFMDALTSGPLTIVFHDEDGNAVTHRGGSRAWRNNNPGNLAWEGPDGGFAKRHGAIGEDDDGFAIFPDVDTGLAAQEALLRGPSYNDLTLDHAVWKYLGGEMTDGVKTHKQVPIEEIDEAERPKKLVDLIKEHDRHLPRMESWTDIKKADALGSLSDDRMSDLMAAMIRQEGYEPGTVNTGKHPFGGKTAPEETDGDTAPRGGHPSRKRGSVAGPRPGSDAGASRGGMSDTSARPQRGHPGFNRPADPLPEPDEFTRLLRFRSPTDVDGPDAPGRREILDLLRTPVEEWSGATRDHVMRSTLYRRTDDPDHERTVNTVTAWFERRYPEGRPRRRAGARPGRGPVTFSAPRSGGGRSRSRNDESA